jgi:hypothetical protein
MDLLNTTGLFGWRSDFKVFTTKQRGYISAIATGKCYNGHSSLVGSLYGLYHIVGLAAGGDD